MSALGRRVWRSAIDRERNKPERMWFWRRALRSAVPGDTGVGILFTLVIPNWSIRLPGFPYHGDDPDGFMKRAEIETFLKQYAASFRTPVRFGVTVTAINPAPNGGRSLCPRRVAISTPRRTSSWPPAHCNSPATKLAEAFPPNILQMHSSSYRSPDGLPSGAVLVVGSADTGCQITEELYESDRQVYLCVGRSARRPRRYRGRRRLLERHPRRDEPNRR